MIILDRNVLEIKMVDKIFFYCFIMVLEIELIIIYMWKLFDKIVRKIMDRL